MATIGRLGEFLPSAKADLCPALEEIQNVAKANSVAGISGTSAHHAVLELAKRMVEVKVGEWADLVAYLNVPPFVEKDAWTFLAEERTAAEAEQQGSPIHRTENPGHSPFSIPPCPGCGSPPAATDVDDVCPRCGAYLFRCRIALHVPLASGEPIVQYLGQPFWKRLPPSQVRAKENVGREHRTALPKSSSTSAGMIRKEAAQGAAPLVEDERSRKSLEPTPYELAHAEYGALLTEWKEKISKLGDWKGDRSKEDEFIKLGRRFARVHQALLLKYNASSTDFPEPVEMESWHDPSMPLISVEVGENTLTPGGKLEKELRKELAKTDQQRPAEISKRPEDEALQATGEARSLKEPPAHYIVAYRRSLIWSGTQEDLAKELSHELKRPLTQPMISRMLKRVKRWLAAGNVLPNLPTLDRKKPISLDPERIDLGKRQDGLSKRQRARPNAD